MQNIIIAVLIAFALSLVLCAAAIPVLKKAGSGQHILSYVKEHAKKEGTPTMGGLAFVFAAVFSALLFSRGTDKPFYVALAVGLGYLAVGFLDDMLKQKRGKNLGLRPYQKIIFQFAVAVMASLYCCIDGLTVLRLPYSSFEADIGWWMLPLGVLVFLGTVNGVNLTDGLDGLAAGTSAVFFLALGTLISLQGGGGSLPLLCFCLTAALAAYLVFNTGRASLFMGDTGSLSLGGFAACVALFSGNALVVPIAGLMFVLSSISVILQVIYYKKTGKRIFLMAPLHHHFQQKGYSEGKIAYAYAAVTAILSITLLLPFV